MLSYDRVRINLRGHQHLEVNLTEIPKVEKSVELFPPIIDREINESEDDAGIAQQIDWEKYKDVPALLWYPPFQLEKYVEEPEAVVIPKKMLNVGISTQMHLEFLNYKDNTKMNVEKKDEEVRS